MASTRLTGCDPPAARTALSSTAAPVAVCSAPSSNSTTTTRASELERSTGSSVLSARASLTVGVSSDPSAVTSTKSSMLSASSSTETSKTNRTSSTWTVWSSPASVSRTRVAPGT